MPPSEGEVGASRPARGLLRSSARPAGPGRDPQCPRKAGAGELYGLTNTSPAQLHSSLGPSLPSALGCQCWVVVMAGEA